MDQEYKLAPSSNQFVVDGFPRTGTTSLVRLLNCHPDIKCLVEPFHPRRYGGQFHRLATQKGSVQSALALIRYRWNGLKHVWLPDTGFPFHQNPSLNDELILSGGRIIWVQRRNFLKRYISNVIAKSVDFWIGTRQQFITRLRDASIPELDPRFLRQALQQEREAIERRVRLLQQKRIPYISLVYEDFYGTQVSPKQQLRIFNDLLSFLGFSTMTADVFTARCTEYLDETRYRWCSEDVYRQIPGIARVEQEVGSEQNGWLFG